MLKQKVAIITEAAAVDSSAVMQSKSMTRCLLVMAPEWIRLLQGLHRYITHSSQYFEVIERSQSAIVHAGHERVKKQIRRTTHRHLLGQSVRSFS